MRNAHQTVVPQYTTSDCEGVIERAWDRYYDGNPTQSPDLQTGTPHYDSVYPNPLARHVRIMTDMVKKSIDAAAARGDKKAYFFEDGCGSGRYRTIAKIAADYAKEKGYDMHIVWIGNDVSQKGLDLYKDKLIKEGFAEGYGYEPFFLERKFPAVTKDNLTYKFIKSTEQTTAQELEHNIGVVVDNSFDVFGIDGYRLDRKQRLEMMEMRGRITRNEMFFTVPGPAYKKTVGHLDKGQLKVTTSLTNSPNTVAILHTGDITYKRGNLTIPFHIFSENELKEHLSYTKLKGRVFISNARQEKEGLVTSEAIDKEDEEITAYANQSDNPFVRAYHAAYWGVIAKSELEKHPVTGRVINKAGDVCQRLGIVSNL